MRREASQGHSTGKTHGHERPGMCANHGGSQGQRGEAANRIYAPV